MKPLTCGIIIVNPANELLLAHVTNASQFRGWTIPKGLREENETPVQAVVREVREEIGYHINCLEHKLEILGEYPYVKKKDIFLVIYRAIEGEFDPAVCECISTFDTPRGPMPEVNGFKFVGFDDAVNTHLSPKLAEVINNFKDKIVR